MRTTPAIAIACATVVWIAGGSPGRVVALAQDVPAPAQATAAAVPASPAAAPASTDNTTPAATTAPPALPSDYVIGSDDVLRIIFWRDKELSGDYAVRPDGKISLPLLNDVHAAGLTPEQLRVVLMSAASKFVQDPAIAVIVKQVNSRRVFITGQVDKPGAYALNTPTTVIQLIAIAGGIKEYADRSHIVIMRLDGSGHQFLLSFDYDAVSKRHSLHDNIELRPGDTVIVP